MSDEIEAVNQYQYTAHQSRPILLRGDYQQLHILFINGFAIRIIPLGFSSFVTLMT
jgi:hypothetical protein